MYNDVIWLPPSLSELTPIILNMELIHLGLQASKYQLINIAAFVKRFRGLQA